MVFLATSFNLEWNIEKNNTRDVNFHIFNSLCQAGHTGPIYVLINKLGK